MADRRNHRRRGTWPFTVLGGLVASLTLGGCSPQPVVEIPHDAASGGQTQSQLDETLSGIAGLEFTKAEGSRPNVARATGYTYELTLDPGYEIADAPALVDFLVLSAWSVRDGYQPNTTIEIRLDAGPSASDKIDIVAAAEESGWVPVGSQSHRIGEDGGSDPEFANGTTSVSIWLDNSNPDSPSTQKDGSVANRERLGEWPGDAPTLADDVVISRTTSK